MFMKTSESFKPRSTKAKLLIYIAALIAALFWPRDAQASVFDDLASLHPVVVGLRASAKAVAGGASEGVREQLEKLIDTRVDPLLDKVDGIVAGRIDQAYQDALHLLREAQFALNQILEQTHRLTIDVVNTAFNRLDSTIATTFGKIDALVQGAMCRFSPEGGGLKVVVKGIPFAPAADDEITVKDPAQTECYREFLQGTHPRKATFRGWQFYVGAMCEARLSMGEINPQDPISVVRTERAYEEMARLAAAAVCTASTEGLRKEFIRQQFLYAHRAEFLQSLRDGSSSLIRHAKQ
jgi:hypothetical protein